MSTDVNKRYVGPAALAEALGYIIYSRDEASVERLVFLDSKCGTGERET